MQKDNILIVCGGGGSEHDISLISADFVNQQLKKLDKYNIITIQMDSHGIYHHESYQKVIISNDGYLKPENKNQKSLKIDFVIPCMHGYPTETGHFQAFLEMNKISFFGCGNEASMVCFNKLLTKFWFEKLKIPTSKYIHLSHIDQIDSAHQFFEKHRDIFIKATHQGSSVGCYHVSDKSQLKEALVNGLKLSPYVLLEKTITGRELEIAVYQYNGKLISSQPGEIICPDKFYNYDQKYASDSNTKTLVNVELPSDKSQLIEQYAKTLFRELKLRHLARVDFFLDQNNNIFLNEINTFPGMTSISMFPKMLEANGHSFSEFLDSIIKK